MSARNPAKRRLPKVLAPVNYGVGPPIDSEAALDAGLAQLRLLDPEIVSHMLEVVGRPPLRRREAGYEGLAAIVVSQQVSTASASAIFGRLRAVVTPFDPPAMLAASDAALRGCGLSIQKIRALRSIGEAVLSGALPLSALARMPADEAVRVLVAVKGIGPWTADIFLLFCLGHADAWPAGDLALQEAARIALQLESRLSTAQLHEIGERWRPHRGVAARLLWSYYRAAKGNREGMSLNAAAPNPHGNESKLTDGRL